MAKRVQLRRGTTTEHNSFTGAQGELTYDTTLKSLVLHDGVTVGGVKIPYLSSGCVPSTMLPTATESVVGASKIATTAIAQAGVNDTDIITAKKLRDALNATGVAPVSACRAWVNFSASGGVITVKGSLNIASVTRVSAGVYTVNFNIPMPIENYAVFVSNSGNILNNSRIHATSDTSNPTIKTVNSVQVAVSGTTAFGDTANMSVGVFC